jgi:branched-chain amino acid transport system permease protein
MTAFLVDNGFLIVSMILAALLALSLYLPLMAGQLSLASPGFYALGGYIAAFMSTKVFPSADGSFPISLLLLEMALAGSAAGLVAIVVGIPALRLRGIYLALATIAFVEILRVLSLSQGLENITGGAIGIFNIPQPFRTQLGYLWIAGPLLLISMFFVYRLERIRVGRAFIALREDELAADAMGISPTRYKELAFTMGAALAGIVGALSAHLLNTWNARQGTFDASINYLAFVLIGGSRTFLGPIAGGLALTALPELLRSIADRGFLPGWLSQFLVDGRLIIYGVLIAVGAVFFPQGMITPDMLKRRRKEIVVSRQASSDVASSPENEPLPAQPAKEPPSILEVRAMTRRFGGLLAVNNVSFSVHQGEIFGLIGPNGAGKTTLFNLITGLTPPSSGSLLYREQNITGRRPHRIAALGIARTFQNIRLFGELSALQNVMIAQHIHTRSGVLTGVFGLAPAPAEERNTRRNAMDLLELVGLASRAEVKARNFAYGDQRRLEIARALALKPQVLLLDEPAAGMNSNERQSLTDFIRQIRKQFDLTVLLIEHHVPLVMGLCDRIAVLDFGQLIALGDPAKVQNDPAVIEAYLGD